MAQTGDDRSIPPSVEELLALRENKTFREALQVMPPEESKFMLAKRWPFFNSIPEENFTKIIDTLSRPLPDAPPGPAPLGGILDPLERAGEAVGVQGVGRSIQEFQTEGGELWDEGFLGSPKLGKVLGGGVAALSPFAPAIRGAENVARVLGSGMAEKTLAEMGPEHYLDPKAHEYLKMSSLETPRQYSKNLSKITNLTEDRPTTGWAATDTLADIISAVVPVGEALAIRTAYNALKQGNRLKALAFIREAIPEAVGDAREFLRGVSQSTFDNIASQRFMPEALKGSAGRAAEKLTPQGAQRTLPGYEAAKAGSRVGHVIDPITSPGRAVRRAIGEPDPAPNLWTTSEFDPAERAWESLLPPDELSKIDEVESLARKTIDDDYDQALEAGAQARRAVDSSEVAARRAEQLELPPEVLGPLPEPSALQTLTPTQLKVLRARAKDLNLDARDLSLIVKQVLGRSIPTNKGELDKVNAALKSFEGLDAQDVLDLPLLILEGRADAKWMSKEGAPQTLIRQGLAAVRWSLSKQGEAGKMVARMMDDVDNASERRAGVAVAKLTKLTEKLTKAERVEVRKFLDLGTPTKSSKTQAVASELRVMLNHMAQEASDVGLKVRWKDGRKVDFNPKDDYFPRLLKREILSNVRLLNKAADHLVSTHQVKSHDQALMLLKGYMDIHSRRRFGSLEKARELDLPEQFYETDLIETLSIYFERGNRRLEEARVFGVDDENLAEILKRAELIDGIDTKFMEGAIKTFIGSRGAGRLGSGADELYQMARGLQTVTRLTLAPVINMSQSVMTLLRTDMTSTLYALTDVFKGITKRRLGGGSKMSEAEEFALQAGATLESTVREIARQAGGQSEFVGRFMRGIGFNFSERLNRTIGAVAGRKYAERMANKYVTATAGSRSQKLAGKELARLGIDPINVSRRSRTGGTLSQDELLKAAQQVVNDSQFRARVQDLPLFWTTPEGKVLTQFKNFVFNATKLIGDEVFGHWVKRGSRLGVDEVKDPARFARNMAYLLTIFPASGAAFENTRRWGREMVNDQLSKILPEEMITDIEFQEAPEMWVEGLKNVGFSTSDSKALAGYIENMASAGALGIFIDMFTSAQYGDRGMSNFLMGPTFRQAVDTMLVGSQALTSLPTILSPAASKTAKREKKEALAKSAGKAFQRHVPIISPFLTGPEKETTTSRGRGRGRGGR